MLTIPQYIERIVTDRYGREFRAVFAITIVKGEYKAKLVSVEPLGQSYELGGKSYEKGGATLCLPCASSKLIPLSSYLIAPIATVSPYFSLEFLMTSQPTRAPSIS